MRRFFSTALVLAALLAPAGAHAFSVARTDTGQFMRWTVLEVNFYLGVNGSDDISNGSDLQAIRDSFASWQTVTCSYLSFREMGTTTVTNVIPTGAQPNGKNELIWVEGSTWQFGVNTLGVTSPLAYTNGQIVESDIAFNGYLQRWTTSDSADWNRSDVESVAVHEIGHLFGLQHNLYYSESDPPTMAPYVDPYNRTRSLSADDRMAICFLYPESGEYACTSNSQCPYILDVNRQTGEEYYADKLDCSGGACEGGDIGPQPAPPGAACQSAYDCASYFCVANPTDGTMRCRESCRINAPDCRTAEECYQLSGNTGACMPEDVIPDTPKVEIGAECARDNDCVSGLCVLEVDGVTRRCRQECTGTDAACGGTEACASLGDGRSACMPTNPTGPRPDGSVCNGHDDCESGLCYFVLGAGEATCRTTCDPRAAGECASGWTCQSYGVEDQGVCMARRAAAGAACLYGTDCTSGMCREDVCVESCLAGACGCGFRCVDDPELRTVCVPDSTAGCLPTGASCSEHANCASAACVNGLCREKCRLFDNDSCMGASGCVHLGDSLDGACVTPGIRAAGSPCDSDLECASLLCAPPAIGRISVCLDVCQTAGAQCALGGTCTLIPDFRYFAACLDYDFGGGGGGGSADVTGGGSGGGVDATASPDAGGGGAGGAGGGTGGGGDDPGTGGSGCSQTAAGTGGGAGGLLPAALLLLGLAILRRRRLV